MKKQKQEKVLLIVSLFIAIIALTVGFAAFSNTLTISSSATVSPNESDFNLTIYGLGESFDTAKVLENPQNKSLYTSTTASAPVFYQDGGAYTPTEYTTAQINNNNLTISNINITAEKPLTTAIYAFMIDNTGEYDAYVNFDDYANYHDLTSSGKTGTCTAAPGTTESLMNEACEHIIEILYVNDTNGNEIRPADFENYVLKKGEQLYLTLFVGYADSGNDAPRADGDFSVKFDDIKFDFSTAAQ